MVLLVYILAGHSVDAARGEASQAAGQMAFQAAQTDAGKQAIREGAKGAWNA